MKKLNKKGFTIVELVIVIAVIAILSAVLIPTFSSIINKANKSNADQAAKNSSTEMLAIVDQSQWDDMVIVYSKGNDYYEYKLIDGVFTETANAKSNKTAVAATATVYTKSGATLAGLNLGDPAVTPTYAQASIAANVAIIVPAAA